MSTMHQDLPLNKEQAEYIKELRCSEPMFSWRAVAREFVDKYPEFSKMHNINGGIQQDGIDLCDAAMGFLGEQTKDGWN